MGRPGGGGGPGDSSVGILAEFSRPLECAGGGCGRPPAQRPLGGLFQSGCRHLILPGSSCGEMPGPLVLVIYLGSQGAVDGSHFLGIGGLMNHRAQQRVMEADFRPVHDQESRRHRRVEGREVEPETRQGSLDRAEVATALLCYAQQGESSIGREPVESSSECCFDGGRNRQWFVDGICPASLVVAQPVGQLDQGQRIAVRQLDDPLHNFGVDPIGRTHQGDRSLSAQRSENHRLSPEVDR